MTEPTFFAAKGLEPRQVITTGMVDEALRSWFRVGKGVIARWDAGQLERMREALACDRLGPALDAFASIVLCEGCSILGASPDCTDCTHRGHVQMALAFEAAEYARDREINNAIVQYEQLEEDE